MSDQILNKAAATFAAERDAATDAQAERVSMEVLNEYRRIAAWLESQAALRGATGDTMHGLAAEALATLIDHEYSRHTIPLYGMLDVWMALYGTSHPEFDEFYDEHGYAEAWSRLMAEVRSKAAVPDAATEAHDLKDLSIMNGWLVECVGEHTCGTGPDGYYGAHEPGCGYEPLVNLSELPGYPDEEKWGVALGDMTERAQRAEAGRDAALAAIERIRAAADTRKPVGLLAQDMIAALDGAPEPEGLPVEGESK